MKSHAYVTFVMAAIVLTVCMSDMSAQTPTGISEQQVKDLLNRIDKNTDRFAKSADSALDKSGYDGSAKEDELNGYLKNFRNSTEGLKSKYKDDQKAHGYAEDVLRRGVAIDEFLKRNPLDGVEGEWTTLRGDLVQLARLYGVNLEDARYATGVRVGEADVKNLVKHINDGSDRYKKSLDSALDNSPLDGTSQEDEINRYVKDFRDSTNRLENHFKEDTASQDAQEVLRRAKLIDGFMRRYPLTPQAQSDWATVRTDLERLANLTSVDWRWQ